MRFNYCYKYYLLQTNENRLIIELSYDNTLQTPAYSAKTNIVFMDDEGDIGHACGVGRSEKEALEMCIRELTEIYPNLNKYNIEKYKTIGEIDLSKLTEISLPVKISIDLKNVITTCYFKKEDKNLLVLTDVDKFYLPIEKDVLYTLEKHINEIGVSELKNFTKEYLINNDFYPTFEALTF